MITKYEMLFMQLREYFRKSFKTTWGKNELIRKLDELEQELKEEGK
jgi:hypothetical protein